MGLVPETLFQKPSQIQLNSAECTNSYEPCKKLKYDDDDDDDDDNDDDDDDNDDDNNNNNNNNNNNDDTCPILPPKLLT